jgi:hypothetical protein
MASCKVATTNSSLMGSECYGQGTGRGGMTGWMSAPAHSTTQPGVPPSSTHSQHSGGAVPSNRTKQSGGVPTMICKMHAGVPCCAKAGPARLCTTGVAQATPAPTTAVRFISVRRLMPRLVSKSWSSIRIWTPSLGINFTSGNVAGWRGTDVRNRTENPYGGPRLRAWSLRVTGRGPVRAGSLPANVGFTAWCLGDNRE